MTENDPTNGSPLVFISYSHKDLMFKEQLDTHLKALSLAGTLIFWSDDKIIAGDDWIREIESARDSAKVAVFLVTGDFLASDFIREMEMNPILQRHQQGRVKLLWIPVRACNWQETSLSAYQAVVSPSKPLAEMKADRDRTWVAICKAIKTAIEN